MHRMNVWFDRIDNAISGAIDKAGEIKDIVEFEFNGVTVHVAGDSDSALIYRDWDRGISGFHKEIVGPYPLAHLSFKQRQHDAEIAAANQRRWEAREAEYRQKQEKDRLFLEGALREAPEFAVCDPDAWKTWQASNQDSYGKGVIDFAERWGRLMQGRMLSTGRTVAEVADECSNVADVDGITGFMYGAAVSVLASCWEHGEELRRWHNLKTQIKNEGERANEIGGVLNPSLLSSR